MDQSSRVPQLAQGRLLLDYLVDRFPYFDRDAWAVRISEGLLVLDGTVATATQKLHKGQILTYRMPDIQEPPADLRWSVAAEDDWYLIANKPGNLLVHRKGRSYTSNLLYLVRNAGNPSWAAADPAHRLDRETSGLVLFAKNKQALAAILNLFLAHQITKEYVAVVAPVPGALVPAEGAQGTIDLPLGRTDDPVRGQIQAVGVPGARAARTHWVWGTEVAPGRHQVIVRLETGRTHQIRVHLTEQGWPLVGDKLYGGPTAARHALHARLLAFEHPFTGMAVSYEAPLPDDWRGLWDERPLGR
ncbi:MAG: RluA family pseudouridine synthase [Spirochaetales bacterium]